MRIDLQDNAQFIEVFASAIGKPLEANVSGIVTDSREVQKGDLYIAIPGERVDGHSFLADVFKKGASCALVNRVDENINGIQIKVENPVKAIGKVSTAWRNQFDIPIVGITGSNGKTSTKELLKHILTSNFNVHATEGNYNTSIGLPLTLLH